MISEYDLHFCNTFEDCINSVMLYTRRYKIFENDDGKLVRERGCFGGACGCTGRCHQLVFATDLDMFANKQYDEKREFVTKQLTTQFIEGLCILKDESEVMNELTKLCACG